MPPRRPPLLDEEDFGAALDFACDWALVVCAAWLDLPWFWALLPPELLAPMLLGATLTFELDAPALDVLLIDELLLLADLAATLPAGVFD